MANWVFGVFKPGNFMTGCDMSFPHRCKSQNHSITITAAHLMSFQIAALHLNIWSRHCVKMGLWVFEFLDPEHFMTDCDTSFPWRCMSERYSINIRATTKCGTQIAAFYLNSWLSYSDKMTHWVFGFLLTWRGHDRLWKVVTWVSHLDVSVKAIP